ncbi:MAG: tRNA epoxyqueuosine(34) reductase QueG [Vicinamibacterales bacterium]
MTHPLLAFTHNLKNKARELGFDACGIAPAEPSPHFDFLRTWIDRGYAGSMSYLERSVEARVDPRRALPSARSVIVTATLYNTDRPYSTECLDPRRAHVARYAWGDDYHRVLTRRLDALIGWMHLEHPEPFEAAPYVDTGPVQERALAQRAGIGWVGKNCCVMSRELGSFVFLGEVLCSLALPPDVPALDQCGSCTLCLDVCPTEALVAPRVLDARRCISYLTVEHRNKIPDELAPDIGTHVYGCDICQEVCPYNAGAPTSTDPAWLPRAVWDAANVDALGALTDAELSEALRDSAMARAKKAGLRRNIEVASINACPSGSHGTPPDRSER